MVNIVIEELSAQTDLSTGDMARLRGGNVVDPTSPHHAANRGNQGVIDLKKLGLWTYKPSVEAFSSSGHQENESEYTLAP